MLTTRRLGEHWALSPGLIRTWIRQGLVTSVRIGDEHRIAWDDIWSVEQGPPPTAGARDVYMWPLATRADLAGALGVDIRTVDRWRADGLPTRNVGANIRFSPAEAAVWLSARFKRRIDPVTLIPNRSSPSGRKLLRESGAFSQNSQRQIEDRGV